MGKTKGNKHSLRDDREDDTIKKLKEVVRELNKEIARLNKELGRRADVSDDYNELLQEYTSDKSPRGHNADPTCPKCGATAKSVEIGKFVLTTCGKCKWRVRK